MLQIMMDQLNKANQNNKLLKKVVKRKVQWNQTNTTKPKVITFKRFWCKTPKTGQTQAGQQKRDRARNTLTIVQVILASSIQESDCDLNRESD